MKKFLPLFLILAVAAIAWKFWPEEQGVEAAGAGETGGVVHTSLEGDPGPGTSEQGAAASNAPETAPAVESPPPPSPSPQPATEGLKVLDQWHRGLDRGASLSASPALAEAIQAFSTIWDGQAGAYAAQLRIEVPQACGPDFAGYAQAFAADGLAGLERALQRSSVRGPAWLSWTEALVDEGLRTQQDAVAGPALGRLLETMEADDYDRERILGLQAYAATLRARARTWMAQEDYTVVSGDSLDRIGGKYRKRGVPLRFGWMMEFNRKSSDRIRLDETLHIPMQPLRLLALRSQCVLALYAGDTPIHLYEVSFGKPGSETPIGVFTLKDFLEEPVDYGLNPPVPYGHPDHRLGSRWIGFEEDPAYGIHGNNCDDQVGAHESAGCVRMINGEVEQLFELIPRGSTVEIRA